MKEMKGVAQPPEQHEVRNGLLLVGSMLVTFLVLRGWLALAPDTDLDVGGFNIHHLFTGLLIVTAGGIPLAVFDGANRTRDLARITFGVGLGMALDEWVYLIATDGTNASYLLPVSLWGGIAVVGLACAYTLALVSISLRCRRQKRDGVPAESAAELADAPEPAQ